MELISKNARKEANYLLQKGVQTLIMISTVKQLRKSERQSMKSKRIEYMDDTVDKLREKHGTNWSTIQYRVWAETIVHTSFDHPPKEAYFKRSKASQGTVPLQSIMGKFKKEHSLRLQP